MLSMYCMLCEYVFWKVLLKRTSTMNEKYTEHQPVLKQIFVSLNKYKDSLHYFYKYTKYKIYIT